MRLDPSFEQVINLGGQGRPAGRDDAQRSVSSNLARRRSSPSPVSQGKGSARVDTTSPAVGRARRALMDLRQSEMLRLISEHGGGANVLVMV
ncbi:hypothetical protein GUJ93_ZPchr0013g34741 [Zizania palustris]|uniref:Uncharacterized protein n=1 Tax=Zizania palustris TaxID=103762 RepID=A0A8J5X190_ZIZPA|nr:hypothetical protein GUJ93_ZPchr0013g34741 [Zizania palustris]